MDGYVLYYLMFSLIAASLIGLAGTMAWERLDAYLARRRHRIARERIRASRHRNSR